MKILLVSDYWFGTLRATKKKLENCGHAVTMVKFFDEAKDLITNKTFDYVLADMDLQYSKGEEDLDSYGGNISDFVAAYSNAKTSIIVGASYPGTNNRPTLLASGDSRACLPSSVKDLKSREQRVEEGGLIYAGTFDEALEEFF